MGKFNLEIEVIDNVCAGCPFLKKSLDEKSLDVYCGLVDDPDDKDLLRMITIDYTKGRPNWCKLEEKSVV